MQVCVELSCEIFSGKELGFSAHCCTESTPFPDPVCPSPPPSLPHFAHTCSSPSSPSLLPYPSTPHISQQVLQVWLIHEERFSVFPLAVLQQATLHAASVFLVSAAAHAFRCHLAPIGLENCSYGSYEERNGFDMSALFKHVGLLKKNCNCSRCFSGFSLCWHSEGLLGLFSFRLQDRYMKGKSLYNQMFVLLSKACKGPFSGLISS